MIGVVQGEPPFEKRLIPGQEQVTNRSSGGGVMAKLISPEIDSLLEQTSRSFYLTLKVLPTKIRGQIGLLYLLARLADTIADSASGNTNQLIDNIREYNEYAQGNRDDPPNLSDLAQLQTNPDEAKLLEKVSEVVNSLERFSDADQKIIRHCLDTIVSGQTLDLQRFGNVEKGTITPLSDDNELDDYTYRVAGCVGEFWTQMSLAHCINADEATEKLMFEHGVRFGKALQLINILRDIPADLALGRCYIPIDSMTSYDLFPSDLQDLQNMEKFRPLYDIYLDLAWGHLDAAVEYIRLLPKRQFRLRAACMLPVLIGQRTLTLLGSQNVLDGDNRVKVLRPEIKRLKNKTLWAMFSRRKCMKLLQANRDS